MQQTDVKPRTAQAAYQARRRQAMRAVTFFPLDKGALDLAVAQSGLSQQDWLAQAVQAQIARDNKKARLKDALEEAVQTFGSQVFWNLNVRGPLEKVIPGVIDALSKHGGIRGFQMAGHIQNILDE